REHHAERIARLATAELDADIFEVFEDADRGNRTFLPTQESDHRFRGRAPIAGEPVGRPFGFPSRGGDIVLAQIPEDRELVLALLKFALAVGDFLIQYPQKMVVIVHHASCFLGLLLALPERPSHRTRFSCARNGAMTSRHWSNTHDVSICCN